MTLLSCVDLPGIVDIEMWKLLWHFWQMFLFFFSENFQLELFDKITWTEQIFDGLSFFTHGVYVAIIPCKKGSRNYLVDSYARDTEGKPDANGSGIIIKLEDILELIICIADIYKNTPTMTQYEIQFLRIDFKRISEREINQIMYKIASNNFQQNKYDYRIKKVIQAGTY